MSLIFNSIANALDHLCCVDSWEWKGTASYDGLCEWAYKNATVYNYLHSCKNPKTDKTWIYRIVSDYLRSVGENPSDYPFTDFK